MYGAGKVLVLLHDVIIKRIKTGSNRSFDNFIISILGKITKTDSIISQVIWPKLLLTL